MRPRAANSYLSIDDPDVERGSVEWYWRAAAFVASWLILGGFLMLPPQFDTDPQLRVSKTFLAVFSVTLLTAGICLTGLLCFAVRIASFRANRIFLPALSSSAVGLLTVFYCFLISNRYSWNSAALPTVIAASITTVTYGGLLLWTHRQILYSRTPLPPHIPLSDPTIGFAQGNHHHTHSRNDSDYYNNYVPNVYPASQRSAPPSVAAAPPYEVQMTDEELIRQQMLMLHLQRPTQLYASVDNADSRHNSSYHIDWTGQEDEPATAISPRAPPINGFYAPRPQNPRQTTTYAAGVYRVPRPHPQTATSLTPATALTPWDGVMRTINDVPTHEHARLHPTLGDPRAIARPVSREERRREIEQAGLT